MAAPAADFILPFGKLHRGKPLSAIPRGYLRWCLDNVHGLYPETRAAIETFLERGGRSETASFHAPPTGEAPPARSSRPRRPRAASGEKAAPAPATCSHCGLPGSKTRPLIHPDCVKDDVPF